MTDRSVTERLSPSFGLDFGVLNLELDLLGAEAPMLTIANSVSEASKMDSTALNFPPTPGVYDRL